MAVYNVEDYIEEAIDSVINQTLDFNKVQLILVDDGSTDNSKEIALNYQSKYPNNILVLSKENGGQASARNYGLKHAKGKYINFLDPDDKLSKNTLDAVYNFYNENKDIDIISLPMFYFENREGPHPLNSKFTKESKIVNLLEDIFNIQLHISSSFIKKEALMDYTFDTTLINGEDALLLNKILIDKKQYGLIGLEDNAYYLYRKRFSNNSTLDKSRNDDKFFTHKLINFSKYLFDYSIEKEGYIHKFIQATVLYDLQWLLTIPEFPTTFTEEDINEFWNYFLEILDNIDEDVILNHEFLTKNHKSFFIQLKRKDFHILAHPKQRRVFFKSKNYALVGLHNLPIYIDIVDIKDNFINILGNFISYSYPENITIEAVKRSKNKDEEIFKANLLDFGNNYRKCLSLDWQYVYNFDLKIPISSDEEAKIIMRVVYEEDGEKVIMYNNIKFRENALFSDLSHYFLKNSRICKFNNNIFYTFSYTFSSFVKNEWISIKKILHSDEESFFNAFLFRLLYLISFIFMKNKRIWLFNDRSDRADDNGKYLFEYSISKKDGVKKYFVVDKRSEDFKAMKKISSNIIPFGSFKHKFLYIFAEKIISSHILESFINPFDDENMSFYKGAISSDLYFLQHGIIKDDISKAINKRRQNLSLFLTSSDFERNSILEGYYNFDEDVVQLFGLPRYDYLQNKNTKKQILFAPTWRNFLRTDSLDIGEKLLLNSEYFSRLNSLLNNKKLLAAIKENGYNLVFKPHPELMAYADLFDFNNDIIISKDDSYQDLFNESSLMITDYSSVFFDFAYLKKPLIYYQYDENNYDKGYFDYETMGFGEVLDDEDILVDKIINYLENDCVMEDKYKERVDTFFKYTDKNNCKRVYEWILKN